MKAVQGMKNRCQVLIYSRDRLLIVDLPGSDNEWIPSWRAARTLQLKEVECQRECRF
jgi:hypothetical protein